MKCWRAIIVRTIQFRPSLEQQLHYLRVRSDTNLIGLEVWAWIFAQLSLLLDIATLCGRNVQRKPTFLCAAVDICTIRNQQPDQLRVAILQGPDSRG